MLLRDAAHLGYSVTHGTQTWEDEDIIYVFMAEFMCSPGTEP